MKRIALIAVTVFSMLGGVVVFLEFGDIFYRVCLLGLLGVVGNFFTLVATRGFALWNSDLPGPVKVIAILGWVVGGYCGCISLLSCL